MLFKRKNRKTEGVVTNISIKKLNEPPVMTITYYINNIEFTIEEKVEFEEKTVKLLFLPIGKIQAPLIPDLSVGKKVTIIYNTDKPANGYVKENIQKKTRRK